MRIALISDIHGNHVALNAILADIKRHAPDHIVCLGDVATIGPQPKAALAALAALDATFILGNHDEAMLTPSLADQLHIAPVLADTLAWGIAQLDAAERAFMAAFKATAVFPLDNGQALLCCHGSPRANTDLILATTPMSDLIDMFGSFPPLFAGGHSHVQMLRHLCGNMLINPGSVGLVFKEPPVAGRQPMLLPWAEYALLDTAPGTVRAQFQRISYDQDALLAALQDSDSPLKGWLAEQFQPPS